MKRLRLIIILLGVLTLGTQPLAARRGHVVKKTELLSDSLELKQFQDSMRVIVGNDTVSMIIPEQNFGRYDRGLYNFLFIPKGKWAFGLTASYGELNTDDVQILSMLNNIDFKGKIYSIKPSISYFIRRV